MSLQTPTTQDISDSIIAQMQANLNQNIPLLPKSFTRVLAKAAAGVFILLYKYGGFIFLQMFIRTATLAETVINGIALSPLTEWGRLVGIGDPTAATRAEMTVVVYVNTTGGTLTAGSQLIGNDNGVTYVTIGAVALNATQVFPNIRAAADQSGGNGGGSIGNLPFGAKVSFANPLAGVDRETMVVATVTTGADAETADAYRQRVLDRFQKRPQGGAYADYDIWGRTVAGIANIYPYTSTNPGQVDVYVEAVATAGQPDGIPTSDQLDDVAAAIQLDSGGFATRRPAGALVTTVAITRKEFTVNVSGIASVDNLAQVQTDITDAMEEFFLARAPYIEGLTLPPRKDRISVSSVTGVVEDIVNAAGGTFTDATVDDGAPVTLYSLATGEKAKVTNVTFI